jgi:hypothetical protein
MHMVDTDEGRFVLLAASDWSGPGAVMVDAPSSSVSGLRPAWGLHPLGTSIACSGFRHGHKAWMDEDQIADLLKSERLGH